MPMTAQHGLDDHAQLPSPQGLLRACGPLHPSGTHRFRLPGLSVSGSRARDVSADVARNDKAWRSCTTPATTRLQGHVLPSHHKSPGGPFHHDHHGRVPQSPPRDLAKGRLVQVVATMWAEAPLYESPRASSRPSSPQPTSRVVRAQGSQRTLWRRSVSSRVPGEANVQSDGHAAVAAEPPPAQTWPTPPPRLGTTTPTNVLNRITPTHTYWPC